MCFFKKKGRGGAPNKVIRFRPFICRALFDADSGGPNKRFRCAHRLITTFVVVDKNPLFPLQFSRKNYQDCFTPCFLLSLNLQVRHISICSTYVPIVLTLCLRQITLPLLYTRQNVSSYKSLYFVLCKQQAFDWAFKAVYIRKIK